jgi:phosphatidylglycerophosphatase C
MNVYDFDNTIFRGDSSAHFYLFCLWRHPRIARRLPGIAVDFARLRLGETDKTGFKTRLFGFLGDLDDVEALVEAFWAAHRGRIKDWYHAIRRPDDLVISAGPEFLLRPVCPRLIGSRIDPATGAYSGLNCSGEEKVRRYRAAFGDAPIEAFYSDSMSDAPLARIAGQAYLVRGDRISPWPG